MAKHDEEMQRLIDIVNVNVVNRVSEPFKVEDAYKPKQKEELKEAIKIQPDTPEEAMAMMQILKNAASKVAIILFRKIRILFYYFSS